MWKDLGHLVAACFDVKPIRLYLFVLAYGFLIIALLIIYSFRSLFLSFSLLLHFGSYPSAKHWMATGDVGKQ